MNIQHFADGEFAVSFEESIRGCQVYLVQSTFPNSDNLMELLLMIDAAKRASAKSIVAVVPYFGWARQDRKDKPRVSIAAKLLADILSVAGINRLITMDLHADQISSDYFFLLSILRNTKRSFWAGYLTTDVHDLDILLPLLFLLLSIRILFLIYPLSPIFFLHKKFFYDIWAQILYGTYNSTWYVLNYL